MLGITALSAALLGTGYAAMTDTVNIGGKVSTANFCVQFIQEPQLQGLAEDQTEAGWGTAHEIEGLKADLNPTEGQNAHSISFEAKNLKVGVPVIYKTTIGNLSSIKAKLDNISLTQNPSVQNANNVKLTIKVGGETYEGTLAEFSPNVQHIVLEKNDSREGGDDEVEVTFGVEVTEGEHSTNQSEDIAFNVAFNWSQTE